MKKILIALALSLVLVGLVAAPAMAKSQSVGAVRADVYLVSDNTVVVGFAVFSTNAAGEKDGLNVEVVVKGLPEGAYELRVNAPTGDGFIEYKGDLKVNKQGNGAGHAQVPELVYVEGDETISCAVQIWKDGSSYARTTQTDVPLK